MCVLNITAYASALILYYLYKQVTGNQKPVQTNKQTATHTQKQQYNITYFHTTAWDKENDDTTLSRKLTTVGDGACGKTSLLIRISRDAFQEVDYEPTAFDTDVVDVFYGNKKVTW